ncbi:Hypothetical predicted protein [Mytilus galloprovincialis]|uniref:Uncharacterized protein n=1 Tax=Mytilus galloprovincialis TaxID=29158 RepID=A0A8B6HMF3_MYTGA|nr:Hypothetical predicted protein [Mytilus galloprovincialis]
MPTEISDLRYPIMFNAHIACKTLRTVESLSINSSIVTLTAVAIDRHNRKINEPKYSSGETSFTDIGNDHDCDKEKQRHKVLTDRGHQKLEEKKSTHTIRAKTTLVLGIVTVVLVLRFLPFLTVMVWCDISS